MHVEKIETSMRESMGDMILSIEIIWEAILNFVNDFGLINTFYK